MSYPLTEGENTELVAVSGTQLDIKKFVYKLIGFLPWIIISTLIAYSAAKLYLRYTPQLHRISAYLLIKDNEESSPDYNVLRELGVITSSKEVQNQIDILESYQLSENIVDSLNLQVKIFAEGRISSSDIYGKNSPVFVHVARGDSGIYQPGAYKLFLKDEHFTLVQGSKQQSYNFSDTILFSGRRVYFVRNKKIKDDENGYNLVVQDKRSTALAIKSAIQVTKMHEMGGIVEIAMLDKVPERAEDIINTLMHAYNTAGVTDKNIVGNKTNSFLTERVDTVSKELDDLELTAEAFKRNNKINDITSVGDLYLSQSMDYDKAAAEQEGQIKLLQSLENLVSNSHGYTDIIPSNNGLTEPTLTALIQQYNAMVQQYQQQTKISTQKDPIMARMKNQIADIKSNILKNIESIKGGVETKLGMASDKEKNYENLLASLPEKEREFLKLERQISVKEQLYLYLLQKKEETELSLVSTINNTRVVDNAFDQGVVSPKSDQIIMFAVLIGIIIPVVIMLLLDFFDNKIADRKEIESGTKVHIIGELSYNSSVRRQMVHSRSRSVLA